MKKLVENETLKVFALNCIRRVRRRINAVSRNVGCVYKSAIAWLKFLTFKEPIPKHAVVENLHPIHALLTFYFCLFAPSIIFFWLFPYGLFAAMLGEAALVLATLEVMHVAFDR